MSYLISIVGIVSIFWLFIKISDYMSEDSNSELKIVILCFCLTIVLLTFGTVVSYFSSSI